ncbi:hypothetical protein ACIPQB_16995 [Caulobacter sp. LARHSG274]
MTGRADFEHFEALKQMERLRGHAGVRYVAIDDLIVPGLYSVTLTLAYTRGMAMFGDAMSDMHFIYCNADFVVGDGSFAYLSDEILDGRNVILGGSVRVVSEEVEPLLNAKVDETGVLITPPRELARYVFEHPHIMQIAKTVNQEFCWARSPNHLFWDVDDQTLIARFYQIFMLCLRPTHARPTIDGYCDYSFVPAFCPNEPIHVVDDSDKVCLLELQGRSQEADDVIFGGGREPHWLASIDEWCTPEHTQIARKPIVYHAGALPPNIDLVLSGSGDYVEWQLASVRTPAPHPGHYYWVYGVAAWRIRRSEKDSLAGMPPELDLTLASGALKHPTFDPDRQRRAYRGAGPATNLAQKIRRGIFGELPAYSRLHPDASGLAPLVRHAHHVRSRIDGDHDYRAMVVADLGGWIDGVFPVDHDRILRTEPLIAATWRFRPEPPLDEVVILQNGVEQAELERILKNVLPAIKPGGRVTLLCKYPTHEDSAGRATNDIRAFAVAPLIDKRHGNYPFPHKHHQYAVRIAVARGELASRSGMTRLKGLLRFGWALAARLSRVGDAAPYHPSGAIFSGVVPGHEAGPLR